MPPSSRTSLFERAPSEKSGELSMQLPKQKTEHEVIVHVQDDDQELVLMEESRMGEQQKQVVVEDEEQEKGKRVDPESSSAAATTLASTAALATAGDGCFCGGRRRVRCGGAEGGV